MKFFDILNKKNRTLGFTLVELLVVISIIGVLSSVVFASLSSAKAKAKNAAIISNFATLRTHAELYYDQYGEYSYNYIDQACNKEDGTYAMYPIEIAVAKGWFFASEPAWSALHGARNLSTDPTQSRCRSNGTDKYAIAIRTASTNIQSICVDYTGAIVTKTYTGSQSLWNNAIDVTTLKCNN